MLFDVWTRLHKCEYNVITGRDLAAAMLSVRRLMFNNRAGDRPEVPDVLVTITHRASDDALSTSAAAERLKSDGIRIVTVGIGSAGTDKLRAELQVGR